MRLLDAPFSPRHRRATTGLASGTKPSPGSGADEAVASPLFTALDALQKKARPAVIQPAEQGQRRVEIGKNFAHHGDKIPARRQCLEFFLGRADHAGFSHGLPWCEK